MCWRGHECLGVCMFLEFKMSTPMSVQNSIFISDVFQIEVSEAPVHSLGSCQKVNFYLARVHTGSWRVCMRLQSELITRVQFVYKIPYIHKLKESEVFQIWRPDGFSPIDKFSKIPGTTRFQTRKIDIWGFFLGQYLADNNATWHDMHT